MAAHVLVTMALVEGVCGPVERPTREMGGGSDSGRCVVNRGYVPYLQNVPVGK